MIITLVGAGAAIIQSVPAIFKGDPGDGGSGGTVTWNSVTGKPTSFTPSTHSHPISQVTNLQTTLDGKAASTHNHAINEVIGLQTALDSKVSPTGFRLVNTTLYLDLSNGNSINIDLPVSSGGEGDVSAQRTIVLTDYAGDCDDSAALAIACKAHSDNQINLLGVVATSTVPGAGPAIRGQLDAYGMQSIPVYAYQGSVGSYNNRANTAVRDIFGTKGQTRTAFSDDVTGLRTLLASVPDSSVKIIDIGAPITTARLLDSVGDAISPLNGIELVSAKVTGLWAMFGRFDSAVTEYNATRDIPSTQRVVNAWPTPLYIHGWEVGGTVYTGPGPNTHPLRDPVKASFDNYLNFSGLTDGKRNSWDPACIYHGIYGDSGLFGRRAENCTVLVDSTGITTFNTTPSNRHIISQAVAATQIATTLQTSIDSIAIQGTRTINRIWNMDEGTGSTITDRSGLHVYTGNAGVTWRTAPVGLTFNGTSGQMSTMGGNDYIIADMYWGAVVRPSSTSGIRMLGTYFYAAPDRAYMVRINAGALEFTTFGGNNNQVGTAVLVPGVTIAANTWYMIGIHATETQVTVRLNGTVVHTATIEKRNVATLINSSQFIGSQGGSNYFVGDMIAHVHSTGVPLADVPSLETEMRNTATSKGVTLP